MAEAPPVCENCRRVVEHTWTLTILTDDAWTLQRELCADCKTHVIDCFTQAATWLWLGWPVRGISR